MAAETPKREEITMTTERLKLVPLTEEYMPMQIELDTDPRVTRYLFAEPRTENEVRQNLAEQVRMHQDTPGYGCWVGLYNEEPIGWFSMRPPEREDQGPKEGQGEIGYRLLPRFWRQGFATEGSQALIKHAFENLKCYRVFGETMVVNAGSRSTMIRLGMSISRFFKENYWGGEYVEGNKEGDVEYAITREEWDRLQQSQQK